MNFDMTVLCHKARLNEKKRDGNRRRIIINSSKYW